MDKICIAIVGVGGWGRNHVRTFMNLKECRLKYIYDRSPQTLQGILDLYPSLHAATSFEQILNDDEVQAVVVATNSNSHYAVGKAILEAGKDALIEKPLALQVDEAEELVEIARRTGRLIQVGHLLLFHPAVRCLKDLIDRGELGEVYYVYCQRLNLGIVRKDENSLWSLAPHDISLANHLLGAEPVAVKAAGGSYLQNGIEDVMFVTLQYPGGRMAHVHVSWLDPRKVRRVTIVGSKKMVVFDDLEPAEKIRVYDKGVARLDYENYGESLAIRSGDIHIPSIPNIEPLKIQAQHFIECVRERRQPLVDGREGLAVVRALAAASRELVVDPNGRS